jgi:hypothetical protein
MSSPIFDYRVSDRKVAANRENAKKSTGPKTDKGKAISSLNALTHGILAKKVVALGPPLVEDPAHFYALLESLRAHYKPVGVLEDVKVEEIATINWNKLRLQRYETAGIAERLSATIEAARSRTTEERYGLISTGRKLGSVSDPKLRPVITAKELQDQLDLVKRLQKDGAKIEDDQYFLAFVYVDKVGGDADKATTDEVKALVAKLGPEEIEDLKTRFRSRMEDVLDAMWDLRAKTVPDEAAIERSLIPDETEMNKIMRYSAHLNRLEEKAIAMLEKLQATRRRKEGRSR